jgi:HSP20 family protein
MKNVEIRLRELRKQKNLSQEELARELGVSRQSIISLERGEFLPSLPLIIDLLNFFEMPFEAIVCCDENLVNINEIEKGGEENMARDITPWGQMRDIRETFDRMFDEPVFTRLGFVPTVNSPVVNVREVENAVIVEAEVPGVKEENLDLEISEDELTIRGQKKTEEEVKEKDYYRREFSYGSFTRTIPLPMPVQSEKAEAEIVNGVLTITMPKVEEAKAKTKKIEIKKK